MESKRQHPRIYLSLPMEFQVQLPDSQESWQTKAVLKNISQGGLYFECETRPQLQRGNVAEFTFATEPPKFGLIKIPMKAQAVVKRIETNVAGSDNYGIAVQFLKEPQFD